MSQAASKTPPQGSSLWSFSLDLYRSPGFSDACIRLQDEVGVDVNLMFFLLWNASQKKRFSVSDVRAADAAVADWRNTAVIPIRNIRRALKDAPILPDPGIVEDYRTRIKGLELEAERLEHEALSDFFRSNAPGQDAPSALDAARANIAAYENYLGKTFPKAPAEMILGAFAIKHS
jgi:uncharacterized protein (TIGR02444 family)